MRRGTVFFIVSLVFVSLAVAQSYSPEEQKIVDETLSRWKNFAEGNYDAVVTGPKDLVGIEASSDGGLWVKATAEEQLNALKNTPYTLRATPYHIQIVFLGSATDVAYVTYYLSGSITFKDGTLIDNYRTRASEVLEKTDGQWVSRGAHYRKLFEGSGIPSPN